MSRLNTVLGPVEMSELGYTLVHEHIMSTSAGLQFTYPEFIDRRQTIALATAHLKVAYQEGVRTLVDMAPFDLGRDVQTLAEVSRESGVHIIATTGIWLTIPREFALGTPDSIAPLFIKELTDGIEGTGIKASLIKAATGAGGVTEAGEIILRAVARAHKSTGAPISTHTFAPQQVGKQQVDIFEDEGVDLSRVCVGHSNDTEDLDYLLGLLGRGVWLGLDHFPGNSSSGGPTKKGRILLVKRLIDAGYGHRIMLSHDFNTTIHRSNMAAQEDRWKSNPDGFLYIKRRVLPALLDLGVSDQQVRMLNEDNPKMFFGTGRS